MAQLPEEDQTVAGEFTGYYWNRLSQGEKLEFTIGHFSGYMYAKPSNMALIERTRKSCLSQFTKPTTEQTVNCVTKSLDAKTEEYKLWEALDPLPGGKFGDTVAAADRFFSEPENRVMPIVGAWLVAKARQEGEPLATIDKLIDDLRERYIRGPRKLCESGGFLMTESRCNTLGTTLKKAPQ
jgi:hypothetical protein